MAALLKQFGGLTRRAANVAAVQAFARPFAAHAVTAAADPEDSFTNWTTPAPQHFTHAGIVATPTIKVPPRHPAPTLPRPTAALHPPSQRALAAEQLRAVSWFRSDGARAEREGSRFQICFATGRYGSVSDTDRFSGGIR
jgi:hypothetical protein